MNKTQHKIYIGLFFAVGISVTILLAVNGYDYYTTPLIDRPDHADHSMLKPTGFIGHGLGILGSLMMITGVSVYMIRKRVKKLFGFGYLKNWLEFHIFLCSVGPILVLYHTAFKFGGIVAVSFWSMTAVVLSGIIGRFIYIQIPRTIQGQELGFDELTKISDKLSYELKNKFDIDNEFIQNFENKSSTDKYKNVTPGMSFIILIKDVFNMWSVLIELRKKMMELNIPKRDIKEIERTVKAKMLITRRIGLLRTMQKVFRYWHIMHLPFAITMFAIMLIHVAVAILFGYTWIF